MSDAQREMTLAEWVERLPTCHRACKELASLLSDASRVQELSDALNTSTNQCLRLMRQVEELERQLAVAVGALREIVSSQPSGAFDSEPRSFNIARSALARIEGDRPGADTIPA